MKEQLERIRKQDLSSLDELLFRNITHADNLNNTYLQIKQLNGVVSQLTFATSKGKQVQTNNHKIQKQHNTKQSCLKCQKRLNQLIKIKHQLKQLRLANNAVYEMVTLLNSNQIINTIRQSFFKISQKLQQAEAQKRQSDCRIMQLQKYNHQLNLSKFNLQKTYQQGEARKRNSSLQISYCESRYQKLPNRTLCNITNFVTNIDNLTKSKQFLTKQMKQENIYKVMKTEQQPRQRKLAEMDLNRAINQKLNINQINFRTNQFVEVTKNTKKQTESRKNSCRKLKVFSNI